MNFLNPVDEQDHNQHNTPMEKEQMIPHPFELIFENHKLYGDTYGKKCDTMVLHGAGKSSRERLSRIRDHLNAGGLPSVCFDFIGHGETGGDIMSTSLEKRTGQAEAVIRHTCSEPLTLIAASMGAYTAVKLTQLFWVKNLVLLVPAVYSPLAYHLPFGPKFSAAIRQPFSWRESDAFGILENFKGNLLVIAAENDNIIPKEVITRIHDSAKHAKTNRVYTVPCSGHRSLFPKDKDFNLVMNMIVDMQPQ